MQAVQFILVMTLLGQYPLGKVQQLQQFCLRLRTVPKNVAIHPTQIVLEFLLLPPGPFHLPGMGIATGHDQRQLPQPKVTLAQGDAAIPGGFHQQHPRFMVEPGISGIGNRFLLHRGIPIDSFHMLLGQFLSPLGGFQRFAEQLFQPLRADTFPPPRQGTRIDRQAVNKVFESAEILPIGVLQQTEDHGLIAFVKSVFHAVQPDQQTGGLPGVPFLGVERTEQLVKDRPADLIGEHKQQMFPV